MNRKFEDYERVRVKSTGHTGTIVDTLPPKNGKYAYIIDDDIIDVYPDIPSEEWIYDVMEDDLEHLEGKEIENYEHHAHTRRLHSEESR